VEGNSVDYCPKTPQGRYLRFGIREHAMAAVCNGLAAHGGVIPFGATFLVFTGYCLGAIRLSALSHLRVLYVFTHDSIGVGEDGPTHQPVETLATCRAIPNLLVFRPADGNEVSGAYKLALSHASTPSLFSLSRQGCANLEGSSVDAVAKGAYVVRDAENPTVILAATGSEVQLAMSAVGDLEASGERVRVVSFPCWELFEQQDQKYKESVFLPGVPTLSIEAAVAAGWERYSHGQVCMSSFGTSAPGGAAMKHFGFDKENVVAKAKALVKFYAGTPVPNLMKRPF
jgi:transketolase